MTSDRLHSSGAVLATAAAQARSLRSLHHQDRPLVLPNAWDVASAQLVEAAGFPVIATGSGAIAAALGYSDNDSMPVNEAFGAITRISNNVSLPVSADIEAGYELDPEDLVARLLGAGAVGCNLEDTDHHGPEDLVNVDRQAERLAAIKRAAEVVGVQLVLNARVDLFGKNGAVSRDEFDEALLRAETYRAAGADCIFSSASHR